MTKDLQNGGNQKLLLMFCGRQIKVSIKARREINKKRGRKKRGERGRYALDAVKNGAEQKTKSGREEQKTGRNKKRGAAV